MKLPPPPTHTEIRSSANRHDVTLMYYMVDVLMTQTKYKSEKGIQMNFLAIRGLQIAVSELNI